VGMGITDVGDIMSDFMSKLKCSLVYSVAYLVLLCVALHLHASHLVLKRSSVCLMPVNVVHSKYAGYSWVLLQIYMIFYKKTFPNCCVFYYV